MILSGKVIESLQGDKIHIEPFDSKRINPNSYNLLLHEELFVYDNHELDMKKKGSVTSLRIPSDGLLLEPNKLYLARTVEYTKTYDLVPVLEGRSSIGRLGLFVHVTAGFGDVGFEGYWTLELHCVQPVRVYPNVEICQISYHTIQGEYVPYNSDKYHKNQGVQESMLYKEF